MKDKQLKAADKASRKKNKEEIGAAILTELQKIAVNFNAGSKKSDKLFKKTAQSLAKKLSKSIGADKPVITAKSKIGEKTAGEAQPNADVKIAETSAKVTAPINTQPAAKAKRGPKPKPASEPLK